MTSTLSTPMPLEPVRAGALTTGLGQPAAVPGHPSPTAPMPGAGRMPAAVGDITSSVTTARSATAGLRAPRPLPTDAPPGTEPALWALLDPAELAFFGVAPDAGALTYMRGSLTSTTTAAARGLNLDVRA